MAGKKRGQDSGGTYVYRICGVTGHPSTPLTEPCEYGPSEKLDCMTAQGATHGAVAVFWCGLAPAGFFMLCIICYPVLSDLCTTVEPLSSRATPYCLQPQSCRPSECRELQLYQLSCRVHGRTKVGRGKSDRRGAQSQHGCDRILVGISPRVAPLHHV